MSSNYCSLATCCLLLELTSDSRTLRQTELLPGEFTCAKDAKDLMTECCKGVLPGCANLSSKLLLTPPPALPSSPNSPEFVLTIASEANEICEKESKKTMGPEHILAALKVSESRRRCFGSGLSSGTTAARSLAHTRPLPQSLGFEAYVDEVQSVLSEHKDLAKARLPVSTFRAPH